MHLNKTLPRWLSFERMSPALLSGLILFAASFFTDIILDWIRTPGQARFFNYGDWVHRGAAHPVLSVRKL